MQQSKNQKIASNPSKHSLKKNERYQQGGPQDKNGYLEYTLSSSQKTCLDIMKNNIITFIEGKARNWKITFGFISSSFILSK